MSGNANGQPVGNLNAPAVESDKVERDIVPPDFLTETLLANAEVRLFGREFNGFTLNPKPLAGNRASASPLTQQVLLPEARFARIYGFSYEGNYYKMSAPAVFLVHGPGYAVPPSVFVASLSTVGVEFKDETFAGDVFMWAYQDVDFSVRIDISTGWLQDILIAPEIGSNVTGPADAGADMTGRSSVVGRSSLVGRSSMVGRSSVVGRAGG